MPRCAAVGPGSALVGVLVGDEFAAQHLGDQLGRPERLVVDVGVVARLERLRLACGPDAGRLDVCAGSLGVHDLKTRRAGAATFVDFHLVVPARMPVGEAHDICDRLEDAIRAVQPGAQIAIHVEPETEKAHGIRVKIEEVHNEQD